MPVKSPLQQSVSQPVSNLSQQPDLDKPGLLVMDVDSTLIDEEVIDELGDLAGVGPQISAITARAMAGELDFDASLRARVGLLAGLDTSVFDDVYERLHLTTGAERLIATLHAHGWKVGVVSGGFHQIVDRLAQNVELDRWLANELEVTDGLITGRVVGKIVNRQTKLHALRAWAKADGIAMGQTVAVGDGSNDIPMIEAAGLGVAFCAKPMVQQAARHAINTRDLALVLDLLTSAQAV